MTRLNAGEVLLDFSGSRRYAGSVRAAVRIDAAVDDIWTILKDCESAAEYVPNVLECKLLETRDDGMVEIFRQRAKLTWFLPSFEHDFRVDYAPPERIEVNRVSGPFEVLDGTWWLLPGEEMSVTLVYSLNFEPGMPIPGFVLGRMLRRDVPVILAAIRDRSEAL